MSCSTMRETNSGARTLNSSSMASQWMRSHEPPSHQPAHGLRGSLYAHHHITEAYDPVQGQMQHHLTTPIAQPYQFFPQVLSLFPHLTSSSNEQGRASLTDAWKKAGSPGGKRPKDWLKTAETIEFIEHISKLKGDETPLLDIKPGRSGGTWAELQIALKYAQYLSPEFQQLVNDVFIERVREEADPELTIARGPASSGGRRWFCELGITLGRVRGVHISARSPDVLPTRPSTDASTAIASTSQAQVVDRSLTPSFANQKSIDVQSGSTTIRLRFDRCCFVIQAAERPGDHLS